MGKQKQRIFECLLCGHRSRFGLCFTFIDGQCICNHCADELSDLPNHLETPKTEENGK